MAGIFDSPIMFVHSMAMFATHVLRERATSGDDLYRFAIYGFVTVCAFFLLGVTGNPNLASSPGRFFFFLY